MAIRRVVKSFHEKLTLVGQMGTLLQRVVHAIILFFGVGIVNFFLFHLSPGDPTNLYFGPKVKRENLQYARHQMGLDRPWYEQLTSWSKRVLRGDLGYSWAKHRPVAGILREAIPATLQLSCFALLVNIVLGCLVGMVAGIHAHSWRGKLLDVLTLALYSIPVFVLALIFIFVFSLKLRWLPASQMRSFFTADMGFWTGIWDRVRHLLLPVAVLGLTGAAATSRYVRGHLREILNQNYIRTALAKGLARKRVYLHHALRNALLPVITLLGIYFPFLLSGAFIVEVIFAWPGMGRIAYEAIFAKDYPVIMAVNFVVAGMVITGNLISDLLYRFIDPRVRLD